MRSIGGTVLHYASDPDGDIDSVVDMRPVHVTSDGRDLYYVSAAGFLYGVGQNNDGAMAGQDGVVMFGGRRGANRLDFRLLRCGYLHGPTRDWTDIGGAPTYDRANLSRANGSVDVAMADTPTETFYTSTTATWSDIWTGIDISWRAEGIGLKELVTVSEATRNYIAANSPPTTPAAETWFGFVFRVDPVGIPRWLINGIAQDIEGDFDDDAGRIELRDALDRLIAFMPISYAYSEPDAQGEYETIRLKKRIWKDVDNRYYLLVGARVDELNAMPAGAIVFDPTLQSYAPTVDTFMDSSQPTRDASSDSWLSIRYYTTPYARRPVLKWDLSSITGGSTINSANLQLTLQSGFNSNMYVDCHRTTTYTPTNAACWSYYNGSGSWGTGGGDMDGTATDSVYTDSTHDSAGETHGFDVSADVQDFVDGIETDHGWIVKWQSESTSNRDGKYEPASASTEADRPYIDIDYTEPAGSTINFSATIAAATSTPDDAALEVLRAFSATIAAGTSTPDDAVLAVLRAFSATIAAATSTPDDVALEILRAFSATIAAATSTPDDAVLAVLREFSATIAATTSTPDVAVLAVLRAFSATIAAATSTPDDVVLQVLRAFSAMIAAATSTPDDVVLQVLRAFSAMIAAATSTPDDVTLSVAGIIAFAATILASTNTPDDARLSVLREFSATLASSTSTPDNAVLSVARDFAATIAAGTSTPDDVTLAVLRNFAATIAASTSTPDDVTLLTAAIVGLVHIMFSSKAASANFTSKQPSVTFSGRRPSMTFTGRKD